MRRMHDRRKYVYWSACPSFTRIGALWRKGSYSGRNAPDVTREMGGSGRTPRLSRIAPTSEVARHDVWPLATCQAGRVIAIYIDLVCLVQLQCVMSASQCLRVRELSHTARLPGVNDTPVLVRHSCTTPTRGSVEHAHGGPGPGTSIKRVQVRSAPAPQHSGCGRCTCRACSNLQCSLA